MNSRQFIIAFIDNIIWVRKYSENNNNDKPMVICFIRQKLKTLLLIFVNTILKR